MEDKKGLSEVVSSVLLILLVLAGVAIMWVVIRQFIVGTTSQLSSSALAVSFTILPGEKTCYWTGNTQTLTFNVRRDQGGGEARVSTLKFVLRDGAGREVTQDWSVPGGNFKELEAQRVDLTISGLPLRGKITSIKVQPLLILPDGTTQVGMLSAEQLIKESQCQAF